MLPGFDCYGIAIEDQALAQEQRFDLPKSLRQQHSEGLKSDDEKALE